MSCLYAVVVDCSTTCACTKGSTGYVPNGLNQAQFLLFGHVEGHNILSHGFGVKFRRLLFKSNHVLPLGRKIGNHGQSIKAPFLCL